MLDSVVKIIAPHHCYGCSVEPTPLCISCKNDIISEPFSACLLCLGPSANSSGICMSCKPPYVHAWSLGSYDGALKNLIHAMKFERNIEVTDTLAHLINDSLPILPPSLVVTYIPTLSSHRRQRGYDQTKRIAREFAKLQGLRFEKTLERVSKTHQRGFSAKQRWSNAKEAYRALTVKPAVYLLIDDVMTSGATLDAASRCLLSAGASEVWVAVVARQTLD